MSTICKWHELTHVIVCHFLLILISAANGRFNFEEESLSSGRREFDLLEDVVRQHRLRPLLGGGQYSNKKYYLMKKNINRNYKISDFLFQQIIPELVAGKDFTFLATIRQQPHNRGSIISFTHQRRKRFLELQSVWHRREFRFHHLFTLAATHVHTERLPFLPTDGRWHRIALSLSGTLLELRIDCRRVYTRRIPFPPPQREFVEPHRRIQLWIGQRGLRRSIFLGAIAEAKIITGPNGYIEQCSSDGVLNSISRSRLTQISSVLDALESKVETLQRRLELTEIKLKERDQCECTRSCKIGEIQIRDGETWKNGSCSSCTCLNGHLNCSSVKCPIIDCKYPVWPDNACCPKCLSKCEFRGLSYEHGEASYSKTKDRRVCVICTCHDGGMRCKQYQNFTAICPPLTCPPSERFTTNDECCTFCPGMDFCSSGHRCHRDAECINLATRYACRCRSGYSGNGYHCQDIDECNEYPGAPIKLCGYNSHCHNLEGSYRCTCSSGFEKGPYNLCRDIDECLNASACPANAECVNTIGSFKCQCNAGYRFESNSCVPICSDCQNGGICVGPDRCKCPFGFYGEHCEKDVDECALGIHSCPSNSKCQNLPGSYHCQCQKGYTSLGSRDGLCRDIDECKGPLGISHTCNSDMVCLNLDGNYQCLCKSNDTSCRKECIISPSEKRSVSVIHGNLIEDINDPCNLCKCHDGVLKCVRRSCNCSESVDVVCCPECYLGTCFDKSTNTTYKSGQSWIKNCKKCHCLNGTTACNHLCPPSQRCDAPEITPAGHCCPVCPTSKQWACVGSLSISHMESNETCSLRSPSVQENIQSVSCLQCQCRNNATCCTQMEGCTGKEMEP